MKIRYAAAAALGAGLALTLASPAAAQDDHYPAAGWQVRQIATGDTDWSPAADSTIVDATTVELTKPDGTTGTSIETTNLGLEVAAGDTITVDYTLLGGADVAAGAVRLFYYDHPDADTLSVAPTAFVAADGSGTLELAVAGDGTVGTLGLVYDASNTSAGTVRVSGLEVAGTSVLFVEPPTPSPSPSASPSGSPSPSPSASVGPASPAPSAAASPAGGGSLPQTGSALPLLAGGGAVLAGLGGGLYALARRRVRFTA